MASLLHVITFIFIFIYNVKYNIYNKILINDNN